jgi:hypothetical protein
MATVVTTFKIFVGTSEKLTEGYAVAEGNDILEIMHIWNKIITILIVAIMVFIHCCNGVNPEVLYVPEVTFAGYFNNTYDSLTGNWQWPNTCEMVGDTIRIYCYSSFFSEASRIRLGDFMRLDLWPPDSGEEGYQKGNILFHLARYHDTNESYTINPADTIDVTINFESRTVSFSHSRGGSFELDEIHVSTPPVAQGRYLEIKEGHLIGMVHR